MKYCLQNEFVFFLDKAPTNVTSIANCSDFILNPSSSHTHTHTHMYEMNVAYLVELCCLYTVAGQVDSYILGIFIPSVLVEIVIKDTVDKQDLFCNPL